MAEELGKLTKSQRRRANERSRKRAIERFEADMGPVPDYIKELYSDFGSALTNQIIRQISSSLSLEERAPPHLVEYDEEPFFKQAAVSKLARAGGKGRSAKAEADRSDLKYRYSRIWGKRGQAKALAGLETESGNDLSVRTVQRWFKADREKRQT